jgi:hypothetical protein
MKNLIFILFLLIGSLSFSQEKKASIAQNTINQEVSYSFNTEKNFPEREYNLIVARLKKEIIQLESISIDSASHELTFVLKDDSDIDLTINRIIGRFNFTSYEIHH